MSLDIWSRDDIRNVILAASAAGSGGDQGAPVGQAAPAEAYRQGFEAALATLSMAFGIPVRENGRLRSPGVVVPGARLAVSYRAEKTLERLLRQREEWQV